MSDGVTGWVNVSFSTCPYQGRAVALYNMAEMQVTSGYRP